MKAKYFGKIVTVLRIDKGQALIQRASGQQPRWVDYQLLEVAK
jgi:hypothetical protein